MPNMKKEVQSRLVGNMLLAWCAEKAKQTDSFVFRHALSSGHRIIRFSTEALETVFTKREDKGGYWNNGYHMLYEINNAEQAISLFCVASPIGLSAEEKQRFSMLVSASQACTEEKGSLYRLRSWNLSEELENTAQILGVLNQLYEHELAYFETELTAWRLNHHHKIRNFPVFHQELIANTDLPAEFYIEGAQKRILQNRYERNPKARARCIAVNGTACKVCGFDFGTVYGEAFSGMIEVHHKKPLHEIGQEYVVDPVHDLVPVCSNCHMVIHHNPDKVYSIDEAISPNEWK